MRYLKRLKRSLGLYKMLKTGMSSLIRRGYRLSRTEQITYGRNSKTETILLRRIFMEDLRQQLDDLRKEAKEQMEDATTESRYYSASGEHAAYKNMIKILEEREQEIEETYYHD